MSAALWLLFFCLLNMCLAADLPNAQPTYTTRYDYLDIDKILTNDRILKRLMDCIMDRGPCTREGKELKRIIPDALKTNCSKCNDRQKMNTGRALAYLLHYKPEYWFELLNRFDQDGSFRRKLNIDADDSSERSSAIVRKTRSIFLNRFRIEPSKKKLLNAGA
uniref:Chemosensory protein n=1 Tax=Phenacoccus solenopsis TaxID=483260 RepID=A0A0C5KMA8_9HEMI|nr:chemosensory protein [Phenacoccus solenopsis]